MGMRDEISGTFAGTTAVTVPMLSVAYPATVAVIPGAASSAYVEFTVDGGTWTAWSNGTATAASYDVLDGAVKALRFSRTAGAATCNYTILPRQN